MEAKVIVISLFLLVLSVALIVFTIKVFVPAIIFKQQAIGNIKKKEEEDK